jgi:hypothetical protein
LTNPEENSSTPTGQARVETLLPPRMWFRD